MSTVAVSSPVRGGKKKSDEDENFPQKMAKKPRRAASSYKNTDEHGDTQIANNDDDEFPSIQRLDKLQISTT